MHIYQSPIGPLRICQSNGFITNISLLEGSSSVYAKQTSAPVFASPEGSSSVYAKQASAPAFASPEGSSSFYAKQTSAPVFASPEGSPSFFSEESRSSAATSLLSDTCKQLEEYFQKKRKNFDLPVNPQGSPFQKSVWMALQTIPYGETCSYQDIAIKTGNIKAVRAVGGANNKNPILLVIPCHRVIQKNGSLGGFACGLAVKEFLLKLER